MASSPARARAATATTVQADCAHLTWESVWIGSESISYFRSHAVQQINTLFNHLVSDLLEMDRHVEAERLGRLHVDY